MSENDSKSYDQDRARKMAENMGKNASAEDIRNVSTNLGKMKRGPLVKVWDKIQALWETFKSPDTPTHIKALIIGGLIYVVSPLDLIPDVIPGIGLLDDLGVVGMVFSQVVRLGICVGTAYAVIKVTHLTKAKLKDILQKKKEYYKEQGVDICSAKVKNFYESGAYNRVDVGLYNHNDEEIDEFPIEADSVSDEIEKEMVITI